MSALVQPSRFSPFAEKNQMGWLPGARSFVPAAIDAATSSTSSPFSVGTPRHDMRGPGTQSTGAAIASPPARGALPGAPFCPSTWVTCSDPAQRKRTTSPRPTPVWYSTCEPARSL